MRVDEAKKAANEATFREANERIRAAQRRLDPPVEHVQYICECDDVDCREPVPLTAEEYERVRADGATFAIAHGHPSEGDVLEEHERYVVVQKPGGGGELARASTRDWRTHERGPGEAGRTQRVALPRGERADREPQS